MVQYSVQGHAQGLSGLTLSSAERLVVGSESWILTFAGEGLHPLTELGRR